MLTRRFAERIGAMPAGQVFFLADFGDLCPEEQASHILSDLEGAGLFKRRGHGIFTKSIPTGLGPLHPDITQVIEALAGDATLLPAGSTALGQLGLRPPDFRSYQYITTGATRRYVLDGKPVVLQHASPRNFIYRTRLAALIVLSVKAIGPERMENGDWVALKLAIGRSPERDALTADLPLMPVRIKKLIRPLL